MSILTTYTAARAKFKKLCDEVTSSREPVIIQRRNGENVALISANELESLLETAHLLRSPKNATRLLTALLRAQNKEGKTISIKKLRKDLGVEYKKA
jgi:antitoxin YefM